MVYNFEDVNDIGKESDPTSYKEAMRSKHSSMWFDAMKDELKSMSTNVVWYLVDITKGAKTVGYKWVYKIKYDSRGNIDKFQARLVAGLHTKRRN